jgi:hypothetical protein
MKMNPHRTEWHVQNFEQYILDWRNQADALIEHRSRPILPDIGLTSRILACQVLGTQSADMVPWGSGFIGVRERRS